jgi:DNA mismatch repair protein MutL
MGEIKHLSQSMIAQIAAGQVVERPANIVKELIENSLDAGSKNIILELENAGKKKIIVTDDGFGMSQEDLELCFDHHTTSKIFDSDDLFKISSFGFRGEALSSIVSSANVRIESKQNKQLAGKFIELVSGKVTFKGSVGMPAGTRIVVSGLFSKLPARKKFLKSENTEMSHILQVVSGLALANCKVSFIVIHNKKTLIDLPNKQNLLERSTHLLSESVAQNLLPISIISDHFKVTGFLGKPQIGTPSKNRQFLFVNGRHVISKEVSYLLKEVFSTLLEPRSNPAYLLEINLAPELVDVNVDPQKTRVKFTIQKDILKSLEKSSRKVLDDANLTYTKKGINGFYDEYLMDEGIAKIVRSHGDGWNIKDAELLDGTQVMQVHNLYLVAQTKRGILILDQHAAHERILYQEFLDKFKSNRGLTIKLKKPINLDLPISEAEFLKTQLKVFEKLGFTIESNNSVDSKSNLVKFRVIKIPKVFETRNIAKLMQEIIHDCIENNKPKSIDVGTHRTISYLACRSAIKAGEKLTPKERKRLVEKLFKTKGKYTCPHGRPVEVELDIKYLDQLFKRVK